MSLSQGMIPTVIRLMAVELTGMWKDTIVTGETEKNHKESQSS